MVSFFGLKFGEKKKKEAAAKAAAAAKSLPATKKEWKKIDQNMLGEGQYFGQNIHRKGVINGSIRPATASSIRTGKTGRSSVYVMSETHALSASSMYDLSTNTENYKRMTLSGERVNRQSMMKAYASDANLRASMGNWSSSSLQPPTSMSAMRPGTSMSTRSSKQWVNPLDVHFGRSSSSLPPPVPALPRSTPSPLSSGDNLAAIGRSAARKSDDGSHKNSLLGDSADNIASDIAAKVNKDSDHARAKSQAEAKAKAQGEVEAQAKKYAEASNSAFVKPPPLSNARGPTEPDNLVQEQRQHRAVEKSDAQLGSSAKDAGVRNAVRGSQQTATVKANVVGESGIATSGSGSGSSSAGTDTSKGVTVTGSSIVGGLGGKQQQRVGSGGDSGEDIGRTAASVVATGTRNSPPGSAGRQDGSAARNAVSASKPKSDARSQEVFARQSAAAAEAKPPVMQGKRPASVMPVRSMPNVSSAAPRQTLPPPPRRAATAGPSPPPESVESPTTGWSSGPLKTFPATSPIRIPHFHDGSESSDEYFPASEFRPSLRPDHRYGLPSPPLSADQRSSGCATDEAADNGRPLIQTVQAKRETVFSELIPEARQQSLEMKIEQHERSKREAAAREDAQRQSPSQSQVHRAKRSFSSGQYPRPGSRGTQAANTQYTAVARPPSSKANTPSPRATTFGGRPGIAPARPTTTGAGGRPLIPAGANGMPRRPAPEEYGAVKIGNTAPAMPPAPRNSSIPPTQRLTDAEIQGFASNNPYNTFFDDLLPGISTDAPAITSVREMVRPPPLPEVHPALRSRQNSNSAVPTQANVPLPEKNAKRYTAAPGGIVNQSPLPRPLCDLPQRPVSSKAPSPIGTGTWPLAASSPFSAKKSMDSTTKRAGPPPPINIAATRYTNDSPEPIWTPDEQALGALINASSSRTSSPIPSGRSGAVKDIKKTITPPPPSPLAMHPVGSPGMEGDDYFRAAMAYDSRRSSAFTSTPRDSLTPVATPPTLGPRVVASVTTPVSSSFAAALASAPATPPTAVTPKSQHSKESSFGGDRWSFHVAAQDMRREQLQRSAEKERRRRTGVNESVKSIEVDHQTWY